MSSTYRLVPVSLCDSADRPVEFGFEMVPTDHSATGIRAARSAMTDAALWCRNQFGDNYASDGTTLNWRYRNGAFWFHDPARLAAFKIRWGIPT